MLACTGLFFFVATRGKLIWSGLTGAQGADAHVYPLYSNMLLIKLVDFQPIISAILPCFSTSAWFPKSLPNSASWIWNGRKVLITSCAFGNVIPLQGRRSTAVQGGVERVLIVDIIHNAGSFAPTASSASFPARSNSSKTMRQR